ncbi:hypothetical protein FXF61_10185 [Pseudomonas sp. C27(2019)]|uniref:hypothetical protein n=1 Tax=Pseudomonas sp. C27(2019) TaxID=2604941 RepID=UPI0012484B01|nr:hypothetical protein [Pseudomonas sp. C27(2019)]QEY59502.1 hypothetical protein FXF61_10185 [Pseudomonas sp. C27(2019)]
MLVISVEAFAWSAATLIYSVAMGWLLLALFAKKPDMRISRPLLTMTKIAGVSSVVFLLASVPSYVARVVNPDILPFIMPYTAVLFAVSFIVFIQKLESKRSGWHQAAVSLWLAALISAALIVAQLVLRSV